MGDGGREGGRFVVKRGRFGGDSYGVCRVVALGDTFCNVQQLGFQQ